MKKLYAQRHVIRQNLVVILGLCLGFYFSYHLVTGERSYLRYMLLEAKHASLLQTYETVKEERTEQERLVVMMRPGSIDRDLLEERARQVLGYRMDGEIDVLMN